VDQSDILAAQMYLEAAIKEVEADALGIRRAQAVKGVPSRAGVLEAPWTKTASNAALQSRDVGSGSSVGPMATASFAKRCKGRVLARASREVDEDDQALRRLSR
jgi:hypothetical protein